MGRILEREHLLRGAPQPVQFCYSHDDGMYQALQVPSPSCDFALCCCFAPIQALVRPRRPGTTAKRDPRLTEQPLDLKGSMAIIRRSWWLAVVFVLAGVLAAGVYLVTSLPRYQATAMVLLPPSSSQFSGTSTAAHPGTTDAKLATSAAVLLPAAKSVAPADSLSQLQSHVKASAVASGLIEISAIARSRRQAERLANAVAANLVAFVTGNGSAANSSVIDDLVAERNQLQQQLRDLHDEESATTRRISKEGASSAAGKDDETLLTELRSQAASVNLQVNSVKSQLSFTELGQVSANLGTEVVQRATTATPPSFSYFALPLLIGLLGGALVGSIVVLAVSRARPRAWTRDGLATALGAPVALSFDVRARRTVGDWIELMESYEPGPLEQWNALKSLRELGVGVGESRKLAVVVFEGDRAAVSEAVQLAVTAAASGIRTELSVVAPDGAADTLQAVCAKYVRESREPRPDLRLHDPPASSTQDQAATLSLRVLVTKLDNPAGSLSASWPEAVGIVSISAGFASPDDLARAALAAARAGLPISAVWLANPEAGDDTIGRLPVVGSTKSLADRRSLARAAGIG
jgi:capsular polysaccharide biosynthesis protein